MNCYTESLVDEIGYSLSFQRIRELYDLVTTKDNTQTEILALIAIKSIANDIGATYEEIVANSDEISTKTSASHHLKQLENKKYILKRTVNRKAYYRLREELKSLADTYLLPRFEQKDKYVRLESVSELM
ncbi:MAG: helix-turn-helix transcriptional regulator [Asgard group archaeon]|nr:helix-turn-helix transcriptional regulator [Asgard group archaeon]